MRELQKDQITATNLVLGMSYDEEPSDFVRVRHVSNEIQDGTSTQCRWERKSKYFELMKQPTIQATLFNRDRFLHDFPVLIQMHQDMCTRYPESNIQEDALALVIEQQTLASLYNSDNFEDTRTRAAIVFFLPTVYERFAPALAVAKPSVGNRITQDLMECFAQFSWHVTSEGYRARVTIPDTAAYEAIHHNTSHEQANDFAGIFTPTVVFAGKYAACGGFWHNACDGNAHHGASFTAINYNPLRIYSTEELTAAEANLCLVRTESQGFPNETETIDLSAFGCTDWHP